MFGFPFDGYQFILNPFKCCQANVSLVSHSTVAVLGSCCNQAIEPNDIFLALHKQELQPLHRQPNF